MGYEEWDEVTITRQVVIGGKNKYLINGRTVQQSQVTNLFHSVQLNVNNLHFLIMQVGVGCRAAMRNGAAAAAVVVFFIAPTIDTTLHMLIFRDSKLASDSVAISQKRASVQAFPICGRTS